MLTQTHFPPAPGFSRNHDPPASSLPWNLLGWFLGGLSCSRSANSFQPRPSEPHPDPAGGGGQGVPARPSLARSSVPECQASVNARLRSCLPLPLSQRPLLTTSRPCSQPPCELGLLVRQLTPQHVSFMVHIKVCNWIICWTCLTLNCKLQESRDCVCFVE